MRQTSVFPIAAVAAAMLWGAAAGAAQEAANGVLLTGAPDADRVVGAPVFAGDYARVGEVVALAVDAEGRPASVIIDLGRGGLVRVDAEDVEFRRMNGAFTGHVTAPGTALLRLSQPG